MCKPLASTVWWVLKVAEAPVIFLEKVQLGTTRSWELIRVEGLGGKERRLHRVTPKNSKIPSLRKGSLIKPIYRLTSEYTKTQENLQKTKKVHKTKNGKLPIQELSV